MKGERTKAYISRLLSQKGIPYFDISVSKGYTPVFRHYTSLDGKATGKEQLFFYSCTKPLTVSCAMRLVEEGKLSLDDEVAKYLPAYADTFVLDENGERTPTKTKMTVKHLLTMTGGLSYDPCTEPIVNLTRESKGKADTIAFVNSFVKSPLSFHPGERFQYSLCHDVLGAVVEVASGKKFSEYMQEVVFDPLGMKNSFFHREGVAVADLYNCGADKKIYPVETRNGLVFGENYDSGGAGVIGCVEDYARFAQVLANGGTAENGYRLLKAETIEEIRKEQLASFTINNTFTVVQGSDYGYGLGMRTRLKETQWGLPVGEFGWDGAAGSYLMIDPVRKISIVMGMHVLSWPNCFIGEHLAIVKCVYEDMKEEGLL